MGSPSRRLALTLLRICLLAWPADQRRRDGPPLLKTFSDEAEAERWASARVLAESLAESATVLRTGFSLRLRGAGGSLSGALTGSAQDARFACRSLARSPGFTSLAVIILGVAIGANAAVFGIVDRVLFRVTSYERANELVLVWNTLGTSSDRVRVAAPDVAVLRERARTLASVSFFSGTTDAAIESVDGATAEHVRLAAVTPDLFATLGVRAALGRTFDLADGDAPPQAAGQPPRPLDIVLSHGVWQRAFGSDSEVLGATVRLNGRASIVVGVMPPDFKLEMPPDAGVSTDVDVWVPLLVPLTGFQRADGRRVDQDSDNTGAVIARLASGATIETAAAELNRIAEEMRAELPEYAVADMGLVVRGLRSDATEHARGLLTVLLAGVGIVLLVACLNVSTLLLARGSRRSEELSVRIALGASGLRVVRQLLTESLVLVALGLGLSLVVAGAVTTILRPLIPAGLGAQVDVGVDARMLVFATGVAGIATLVFGIVPALQTARLESRGSIGAAFLRRAGRSDGVRNALVVVQTALSIVLMLGAGLLLATVGKLQSERPGFEPEGALTFSLSLRTPGRYAGPASRAALMQELSTRLAEIPGVRAVGLTGHLPLSGRRWTQPWGLPGEPEAQWQERHADFRTVSSGYFDALGARIVEGRAFTADEDIYEDLRVVIVDRKIAEVVAPGRSALGLSIGFPLDGRPVQAEIVGVVEHIRHDAVELDGRGGLYVPYRQEASRDVSFVLRADGDPGLLSPAVRRTLREIDSAIPSYGFLTLEDYVDAAIAPRRFALLVLSGFAFMALLSVGIGLYGVVALEVSRRTRDIGLRMAVGADSTDVVRSVVWMGMRLSLLGGVLGTALSLLAWQGMRGLVFGTSVADPTMWLLSLAATAGVTLLACWLPARRASRLDPTIALRAD